MAKQSEQPTVEVKANESTFVELICAVWRRRGVVVAAGVVGALIGVAAAANSFSKVSAPVTSYVALSGMKIVQQGSSVGSNEQPLLSVSYPNGTAFIPQDLLDPQVLQRVQEKLGLGNEVQLARGIGVSFDSPGSGGILKRYKDRLGARAITAAEIDVLNLALERDLLSANLSGLRIDVSPRALGVSNASAIAIAKALPQAWREVFTERYGTLSNPELPNLPSGQNEIDLSSPPAIVAAQMSIFAMLQGMDIIAGDTRLAGAINANGQTVNDVEAALRQFYTVQFAPFAAPVFSSDAPSVAAYRKDIETKLAATKRDAQSVDQTLQDILSSPVGKTIPQQPAEGSVQIDGTMLSQVLSLAQRASLTQMMPEMFERRQQIGAAIARLENELVLASATGATLSSPESAAAVSAELQRLTGEYRELYAKALERLRATSSQFYSDLSTPVVEAEIIGTRAMALFIGPVMMALVVAIGYLVLGSLFGRALSRRQS